MQTTIIALALACGFALFSPAPVGAQGEILFCVSKTGQDTNEGSESAPFATIERAQQAVRNAIATGLTGDVRVIIRAGSYELEKPLTFTSADSGTAKHRISYVGQPGEIVVVSGGRRLNGWKKEDNGLWSTIISDPEHWYFRNLFVNSRHATRARQPNSNAFMPFFKLAGSTISSDKTWTIGMPTGQVALWKNITDVELVVLGPWDNYRKRLQSVNPMQSTIVLQPPYITVKYPMLPMPGYFSYLENARSFLDQPGEWYLDRASGALYYWPRPDEDMNTAEVVAPHLTSLVLVRGTRSHPVQNLHFQGLHFAYSDDKLLPNGFFGTGWAFSYTPETATTGLRETLPVGIQWEFSELCSIEGCEVTHLGGNGVWVAQGCSKLLLQGNRFFDIGANGIIVGLQAFEHPGNPGRPWPNPSNQPKSVQIANNIIYDCGTTWNGGSGIVLMFVHDAFISHNLIFDTSLHGIALGTSDKTPPAEIADGYRLENNLIHDVGKMLSDAGGIYSWGIQTNGVIRGNVVYGIVRGPYSYYNELNGIYFDDLSQNFLVESNVVFDCSNKVLKFTNCKPESHMFRDNFWNGTNQFVQTKSGHALSFSNDYFLDVSHQAPLESLQMTVEAWVYLHNIPTGNDPSAWIVCKNSNELVSGNYALLVSHQNVGAYLNIGGGRDNCYAAWSASGPVRPKTWHLLAMTYNGTDLRVYCDGQPVATNMIGRARILGNDIMRVGKRADGYNPSFPGVIRQIRIYDQALTAEQLAAHFAVPEGINPKTEPGLVFHWNANDVYAQMTQVLAAAGPEEPYRSRFERTVSEAVRPKSKHKQMDAK